jgi:hypothetical protein
VESRELVYALIVAAEGLGPLVTRTFEMEIPVGAVANKKISYTNPYPAFRTFTMRCNQPWLLQVRPCVCVCVCVYVCFKGAAKFSSILGGWSFICQNSLCWDTVTRMTRRIHNMLEH